MNKLLYLVLAGSALLFSASYLFLNKSSSNNDSVYYDDDLYKLWNEFKVKYNKKYSDPDFERYRIQVFSDNLDYIKGRETLGITQFMDMTQDEFRSNYLGLKVDKQVITEDYDLTYESGDIDWVGKGAVTEIKDQGQCGSCWSFSTTGAVEGAYFVQKKTLPSLSEQYLVDCSHDGNAGCNGGLMDTAFKFIEKNGIPTEKDYPYKAVDGKCQMKKGTYKISDFTDVKQGDCNDLLKKLQTAPVAIAVDANNFQFYSGGLFKDCQTQLDHGVLLVGYKSSDKSWVVKNSWGTSWGEKGFIRLAAGNTCGLCNMASQPKV